MRTELRLITPQLAQTFLRRNKTNRNVSSSIIEFYADQMRRGQWKLTGQGISFDHDNNLLDGQHRLYAIIASKTPVKFLVIHGVDTESFAQYDTGKRRSPKDVLDIEGIPNASTMAAGIARYKAFGKEFTNVSAVRHQEVKVTNMDILIEYQSDAEFWDETLKISSKLYGNLRLFSKAMCMGFIAHLIKIRKKDKQLVHKFMREIFGLDHTHFNVVESLRRQVINSEMSNRKISTKHKIALLVKTWNYYTQGRDRKILAHANNEAYPKLV